MADIRQLLAEYADFPIAGVNFLDFLPIFRNPDHLKLMIKTLKDHISEAGIQVDIVAGLEARGFLFGPLLALELGVGFVALRKPGKLPGQVVRETYNKEYGQDSIEAQADSVRPGQRVLIVDDICATGGTALAACKLIEQLGAIVAECLFIVEIESLKGSSVLAPRPTHALVRVEK
eukprot:GILJ01013004.1.p1 GENE.GILJ01013004.1~~GILJ01013004.1.p1  ORF type:complete len:176 (+),score=16.10 GILJ01013004.1:84-611(+)